VKKFLIAGCFFLCGIASAQREREYDDVVVPQNKIDLRDLGHAPLDVIPDGESGITSLAVAPNGDLYGATSGIRSHLFVMKPQRGTVMPLGVIAGATSVTQGVVITADMHVFLGANPQGHLLEYVPSSTEGTLQIRNPLKTVDHGQPIAGEEIATLSMDRNAGVVYGLTSPGAHFFGYNIAQKKFTDYGVIATKQPSGEKFEHEKMFSRMLALDESGNVFMSGEDGALFKFDVKSSSLNKLDVRAPAIPGREAYTRVDAFVRSSSGYLYGGTSDGYLFRLDPNTLRITNLGKPLNVSRIAGLAFGRDGKLYGTGGGPSDMARLFSFDPAIGGYELLGFVDVNRPPYYSWQAYEIGAITSGTDGVIYIGENERISKLYFFFP